MTLTPSDILTMLGDGRNHIKDEAINIDNAVNHFNF